MSDPTILQTRVDNRLIHGQVATIWTPYLGANLILVANDKVASNEAQKTLLQMSAGPTIETRFFTIQETIDKIKKASQKQKIFLVIEFPQDALKLIEGGVPIKELVLGNMHPASNKKKVTDVVYVDDADITTLKKITELGVKVILFRVPTDKPKEFFQVYV